jgi:hypothetical protein
VPPLAGWGNFYVITGAAAGTLTGLTFVVITFAAQRRAGGSIHGLASHSTSIVVHFCTALFVSAVLTAPWPALWPAALLLGLFGLAGLAYAVVAVRRMRRVASYRPDREDRLWYVVLPLLAYGLLVAVAVLLLISPSPTLFLVAATTLLLLAIGIHNSWDTVTYVAGGPPQAHDQGGD